MNKPLFCLMFFTLTVYVVSAQSENSLSNASDSIAFQTPFDNKVILEEAEMLSSNASLVVLKSKEWFRAEVLEINKDHVLVQNGGVIVRLKRSEIYRIYPSGPSFENAMTFLEKKETYKLVELTSPVNLELGKLEKERKIYNITYGQVIYRFAPNGRNIFEDNRERIDGLGVQNVVGYRFNDALGLGINVGYANYQEEGGQVFVHDCFFIKFGSFVRNVNVFSTALNFRGSFNQNKVKPYYNFDFGFNKPFRNQDFIRDLEWYEVNADQEFNNKDSGSELGIFLQPAIGIQFTLKSFDLLLDLGYQYANLNYEDGTFFSDGQSYNTLLGIEKIRNFVLRVGVKL